MMKDGITIECGHCGRLMTEYDDIICDECGLEFVEVQNYTGYTYGGLNCIDNILEDKRSGRYKHRN